MKKMYALVAGVLALTIAACGGKSNSNGRETVELTGAGATFQFMRMAYYKYAGDNVFYRIVELKDSFNKQL